MRRVKAGIGLSALVVAALIGATPSLAETWPNRPVRVVVPSGAGSGIDLPARLFADRLAERWKQPVVVENRPGADGLIGTAAFAAKHDDHALLFFFAAPISVFPVVQAKLSYDPARDLIPIAWAVDNFVTIATTQSLDARSLGELVSLARSQPHKLNYNAGVGAGPYIFANFLRSAGLDMVPVNYRESNLAMQDLSQGRIQLAMPGMASALPFVHSGTVHLLAVTNKRRAPMAPEAPTAMEAGYPDLVLEGPMGFFGSRDLSNELRDRIASDVHAVASDLALADRLAAVGQAPHGGTSAEFAAAIEEQRAKIVSIVKLIGPAPVQ
jgi:tripartite-type tricarboxylate transporter receptor subunit TctC